MCMNCGCGEPDDRRDHPENLIAEDIRAAARANGQSLQKTARNILAAVDQLERRGTAASPAKKAAPGTGLHAPAGSTGARPGARGTPESES
jgi:hypothetical protein